MRESSGEDKRKEIIQRVCVCVERDGNKKEMNLFCF